MIIRVKHNQMIFVVLLIRLGIVEEGLGTCPAVGCSVCRDANDCQTCSSAFGLSITTSPYSRTCMTCNTTCQLCYADHNICEKCFPSLGVTASGTCGTCTVSGCTNCQMGVSTCTACNPSLVRTGYSAGNCVNCVDSNCLNCTANINICVACDQNYGVLGNSCAPCNTNISNCLNCSLSTLICTRCNATTGVDIGGTACTNCLDTNCQNCDYHYNICYQCLPTYGFDTFGNCAGCLDTNCMYCDNISICTLCNPHYGIDTNNTCNNCQVPGCLHCESNYSACVGCAANHGWNATGSSCDPCDATCLTCSPSDNTVCLTCPDNLFLSGTICSACLSYCKICTNTTICITCRDSYYLSTNDTVCSPCPSRCTFCFMNISYNQPQCSACTSGSEFNHNNPVTCRQICGDSVTSEHPCDNPQYVPYDGCDDDCQIQPDFNCTVVNQSTTCSYNATLQIQFIKLIKKKNQNYFKLQISIFPPLNIFKTIPQSQFIEVFKIMNQNLVVSSVKYDTSNLIVEFSGEVSGSFTSQQLVRIGFYPNLTTRAEYFASVNSQIDVSLGISIYAYSELAFSLAKIVLYVSYVLTALGWFSFFLGIILRKLPGLQALFVLQFAWLTIVNLNCTLLLPFEQVHPLRYTTGYNLVLLPDDLPESASAPYLTEFGLSQHFFFDNYNITPFFLQTAALIFLLVITIKLRRFVTTRPGLKLEMNHQEIKQEFQSIIDRNEQAHQLLMCSCMTFITYFAFCSALYFKLGTVPNIGSIIVFALGTLIIMFTFVRFYLDPCSFDYFRFSFYITQLAMNHYFIHAIVLIASTVTLVILPDIVFAPLISPALLLVYTLVYRPYKQLRQNVRSAFNLVVMCSLAGFRVYLQIIPKKNLANNNTMLYFMVNFLVLLFLVVIFSIFFTIYSYCEELRLLKLEQQQKNTRAGRYKDRIRKILLQLGNVSVNKQIQQIQQDTTFREILDKKVNLLSTSNNLQQNYLRQQMLKLQNINKETKRLQIPQNTQSKLIQYKKYKINMRNKLKQQKLHQKQRDNIVQNFCKVGKQLKLDSALIDQIEQQQLQKSKEPKNELKQQNKKFDFLATSPTNKQIVKQVLSDENKYVNLRSAIEQVHQAMQKQQKQKNQIQLFMQEFDNIKPA